MEESLTKKQRVKKTFDGAAPNYMSHPGSCFNYFGQQLVNCASLAPGDSILDVATGQGAVLLPAAREIGSTSSAIGIDLSPQMLKKLREKLSESPLPWVQTQEMDAETLTFADASFDVVFCAFALFFFPAPKKALAEMYRVLKPGGTLAVSVWGPRPPLSQWVSARMSELGAADNLRSYEFRDPSELLSLLVSSSFSSVDVTKQAHSFSFGSPEEWFNLLRTCGSRARIEELSLAHRQILQREAIEQALSSHPRGEVVEELVAFFGLAKKL